MSEADLDRLIDRCRQWDEQAWTHLIQQFNPLVTRWLARLNYALRPADIEDLQQEVFRKVIHALPTYRAEFPFASWLFRQTESVAIDDLRKRSAAKRKSPGGLVALQPAKPDEAAVPPGVDPPDPHSTPDELAARQDDHRLLFAAIEELGPPESPCRQLIGLAYFGGFKYEEIAQALQMNAHTVSSTLSKCLSRLRDVATRIFSGSKSFPTTTEP